MKILTDKLGFTLVELLVTISILGILSSIALVVYTGEQKYARMAKRAGDLKAIATALEAYKAANGQYPCTTSTSGDILCVNYHASGWRSQCANYGSFPNNNVIPGLVPTYMPSFPADPQMNVSATTSCYVYGSNRYGTEYKIMAYIISEFSNPSDYLKRVDLLDPSHQSPTNCPTSGVVNQTPTTAWAWAIYTLGAACW